MTDPLTILCLASEVKGQPFLRECHRLGCRVILVTRQSCADGDWPREALADVFYLPSLLQRDDLLKGVSYLARSQSIDRIVALDDFDVEQAALLREHLRVGGMGETTARYFRDKLAMRVRAREAGILVPEFVHALNDRAIRDFTNRVPAPWALKPRSEGSAAGIKKVSSTDELWRYLEEFGDRRSFYVLEQFIHGDVYHIDSIVSQRDVVFVEANKYGRPPMDVAHGGVFTTRTLDRDSSETRGLETLNRSLLGALGLVRGVSHTEFIRGRDDGRFYFLETASRVGGAYIADVIAAATDINLWVEWAKLEVAGEYGTYYARPRRHDYAGVILSLAKQEWPDTSTYTDPEIVMRINRRHHAGLIVSSPRSERIDTLLDDYMGRFLRDFYATQPALEKLER
jgi:biotin carboxylase